MAEFDRKSKKYRVCCCGVTVAALIFGLINALMSGSALYQYAAIVMSGILSHVHDTATKVVIYASFGIAVADAISTGLLFFGLCSKKAALIMPAMVMEIVHVVLTTLSTVLSVIQLIRIQQHSVTFFHPIFGVFDGAQSISLSWYYLPMIVGMGILGIAFSLFKFYVFRAAHAYFRAMARQKRGGGVGIHRVNYLAPGMEEAGQQQQPGHRAMMVQRGPIAQASVGYSPRNPYK